MVKSILCEGTIALGTGVDFGKGLGRLCRLLPSYTKNNIGTYSAQQHSKTDCSIAIPIQKYLMAIN